MNLPFYIARRYFFSKKKRSFISILSLLSMLGVGVGTMALVVVLSVFNGMEELNRQIFKTFEADLTISARQGKRFTAATELLNRIRQTPGVALVTPVIQDNALARYGDSQTVVRLKGVDNTYRQRSELDSAMIEGRLLLQQDGINFAVVSEGIRNDLTISPADPLVPLELWYPQSQGKTLNLLSEEAFRQQYVGVSGVFFIEARYDNVVIVPLPVVRELMNYAPDQLTSIEVQLMPGAGEETVRQALQTLAGTDLTVLTRDELNPDLYRAIRIEKLFVALTLSFIVLVASVNIFFSLSMLVIEKQQDIRILLALGATPALVRRIFLTEGAIIALIGALTGLLLGVGLCWLQDRYGLVGLGTPSSLIDAYPVRVQTDDLLLIGLLVLLVTALTSWFPAQRAAAIRSGAAT